MPAGRARSDRTAVPGDRGWSRGWGRMRRAVLAAGITLVLLSSLVTAAGIVLLRRYDAAVGRADLLAPGARVQDGRPLVTGPLNFLLIGSDLRVGNPSAGQRSDTIIIVHVDRQLGRVFLISIPRDLLVIIPSADPSSPSGDTAKINAAFQYGNGGSGGVRLLSQTLSNLTGVRFDGAVVIEFSGLKRAVDVLGGVRMCIDTRTVSIHTGAVFEPGCRVLGSAEALDYLRQRHIPGGDFGRQRHQQQFLKAVLARGISTGVVGDPVKLDKLLRAVGSAMTVDTGVYSLVDLVSALRGLRPANLTGVRVPTYSDSWDGQSVVVATNEAGTLFTSLRTDDLGAWTGTHARWLNPI